MIDPAEGLLAEPFLNIRNKVGSSSVEQGILGLAFHPEFDSNSRFFVYYTNRDGDSVLFEFTVSEDPNRAVETDERVMRALLDNPRLTEEDVLVIANSIKTPAGILALVARSERWTARRPVRLALLRNTRTPGHASQPLLAALADRELTELLQFKSLPPGLRHAVIRLLEERPRRGGR